MLEDFAEHFSHGGWYRDRRSVWDVDSRLCVFTASWGLFVFFLHLSVRVHVWYRIPLTFLSILCRWILLLLRFLAYWNLGFLLWDTCKLTFSVTYFSIDFLSPSFFFSGITLSHWFSLFRQVSNMLTGKHSNSPVGCEASSNCSSTYFPYAINV